MFCISKCQFESGEILADNGGLQISYNAWKNSLKDAQRTGVKYQNLEPLGGYTPEQLFFISFSQIWCSKSRPEYAAMRVSLLSLKIGPLSFKVMSDNFSQVSNDPHPPPQWRVNGAVQNSIDFAKAFNCPTGALMNPEKKCRLW
jgi:predicted metalloendopeptidase